MSAIQIRGNATSGRYNLVRYHFDQPQNINTYNSSLCAIQSPSTAQGVMREYLPQAPINPFSQFLPGSGYMIRARGDFAITGAGSVMPLTSSIQVVGDPTTTKYNVIHYYFTQPLNISTFNSSLCSVQTASTSQLAMREYRPGSPILPFTQFMPGSGYIIRATSNFTLTGSLPLPTYTIVPNTVSLNEGDTITFNVSTTNFGSNGNGTLHYTLSTISGTITPPPASIPTFLYSLSGIGEQEDALRQINYQNNAAATDKLYYNNYDGLNSTFTAMTVFVNATPRMQVYFTVDRIGTEFGYSIGTTASTPELVGTFQSGDVFLTLSDFTTPTSGPITITSNIGSFSLTTRADNVTEGTDLFVAQLRTDSTSGPIVASTSTITINDTSQSLATYAAVASPTPVNEGSSVNVTITTTGVSNGTTLFYTVEGVTGTINSSDFNTGLSGSFQINNNAGSFSMLLRSDGTTEGSESYRINIRTGSVIGSIVATSNIVTINDTSTTPVVILSGSDNANEAVYNDGWANGDNGGNGVFIPWNIWTTDTSGLSTANFVGNSVSQGFGNINTADKSWGARGFGPNNYINLARGLGAPLSVGSTLSGAIAVQWRNGAKGFDIYNSATELSDPNKIMTFNVSESYAVSGVDLDSPPFNWPYAPDSIFQFFARQVSTGVFDFTLRRPAGANDNTTRTYNLTAPGRVQGIKFYVGATETNADTNNIYINSLAVYPTP